MKYKQIYNYIPLLESLVGNDDGFTYVYNDSSSDIQIASCQLCDDLNTFIETLYEIDFIDPDYFVIINKHFKKQNLETITAEQVENLPMEINRAFITYIIRQDRFVDGLIAKNIKNGNLLFLVKDLKRKDI